MYDVVEKESGAFTDCTAMCDIKFHSESLYFEHPSQNHFLFRAVFLAVLD